VTGRQGFLREACALLERARETEDPRQAAEFIRQAADMLALVAELSGPHDPDATATAPEGRSDPRKARRDRSTLSDAHRKFVAGDSDSRRLPVVLF
jgi:hypothetical protein